MTLIDYDPPERFVAGTVGPPGQRQFFLQARGSGGRITAVALEKQQVSVLAERIDDLLDEFASPVSASFVPDDLEPLDTPVEEDFQVGTMSLAWDGDRGVVVVECHAVGDGFDDPSELDELEQLVRPEPADDPAQLVLRVVLTPDQARSFARRGAQVVAAGRPSCPFCAGPLDPEGHICPRANGYRR